MIWQISSISSADTERLGELLGSQLGGGEVIELRSDLGGGKTTFAIGLVRGAKINDRVSSPTFTLSRIYKSHQLEIHHSDFYRLDDPGILRDQLAESLGNPKVVVLVEWAGIVDDVLPDDRFNIQFQPVANSPDERLITIKYPESKSSIIKNLQTSWEQLKP